MNGVNGVNGVKGMKNDKGHKSVAESLNAVVKTHLVTMSEQYNVYAKAILEMEDKIRSLKQFMLSQDFLNNIRDVNMVSSSRASVDTKSNMESKRVSNRENIIVSNIQVQEEVEAQAQAQAQALSPVSKLSFFSPQQKNSLLWCLYIIVNDLSCYEYEKNYFTAEQEFKVKTIERIKKGENKQILKEHKMSKNMIESGLMGMGMGMGSNISPKVLYSLSLFYNLNIFYVYKNTYYEMFANTNALTDTNAKIHIIQFNPETNYYSVSTNVDEVDMYKMQQEYIINIKKTCLKLDNLDDVNKPLRPITFYSLTDLINIAAKMNILDVHMNTNIEENKKVKSKSKSKSELYTEIMAKCL
jgi:hypothetical protein